MKRLAVLITSHNRKPLTLRCLRALISQELPPGMQAEIYLLDDGSQDGTSQAVAHEFPAVRILRGSGNLFWCRGMRKAWRVAALEDPDFFLLLNDDTFLKPKALKTLLATWSHPHPWPESPQTEKIVVGTCQDPQTRQRSYGGQIRPGLHPGRLIPVIPTTEPSPCDTFEANLVLIPRGVTRTLGMFDDFAHAMADTDYGFRAKRAGFSLLVAPGYLAECASPAKTENLSGWPQGRISEMLARMSRKALPPGDWLKFCLRHAGPSGLAFWLWTYLRPWLPRKGSRPLSH